MLERPGRAGRRGRPVQRARRQAARAHHARRARRLPGQRAVGDLARRPRQPAAGRLRPPRRPCSPATASDDAVDQAARHLLARCPCAATGPSCSPRYAPVPATGPGRRPRARLRPRRRGHRRHPAARRAWPPPAAGATPRSTCPTGRWHDVLTGRRDDRRGSPTCSPRTRSHCWCGRTDDDPRPLRRLGAPRPSGSGCRWATTTVEMAAADDDWWSPAEPSQTVAGRSGRLRLPDRRRRTRRDPTRGRAVSRRASTSAREPTTRRRTSGTTPTWTGRQLAGSVIYELHIGTFTPEGTFDAALGRLDHLRELGVDFVELMPVNAFNGTHNWGYDGVGWFAVHERLRRPGGLPAVRRRLPRRRARRDPGRRLQPPRAVRQLPAASSART